MAASPRSAQWFERLIKAVSQGQLIPEEIVWCSDDPTQIDITLCVFTKEQMIKWIRDSGYQDYGRWMAEAMGESGKLH